MNKWKTGLNRGVVLPLVVFAAFSLDAEEQIKKQERYEEVYYSGPSWQIVNGKYVHQTCHFTRFLPEATENYTHDQYLGRIGHPYNYSVYFKEDKTSVTGASVIQSDRGMVVTENLYPARQNPEGFTVNLGGEIEVSGEGSGSPPKWEAKLESKFFWLEATGYNGKDIVVPEGTAVQYVAKENGSGKKSNWTVSKAGGSSESKSDAASIMFNRSFWGNIAAWFTSDQAITTPVPGVYTISAVPSDNTSFSPAPSATMTVVGTEFKEDANHPYAFDDFTNWNKGVSDYYGSKVGKCTRPYAAVRSGYQGRTQFELTPSPVAKDIEFESSTNRLLFTPATTKASKTVIFNATSGSATLSAKLDSATLANIEIRSYDVKPVKVLVVKLQNRSVSPDYSCFSKAMVNVTVTAIPWYITEITVSGSTIPITSTTIWTDAMRERLRDYYYNDVHPNIRDYDYVQFVLVGEVDGALGIADGIPARDSWVSQSARGRTYPHELGHCLGLSHRNTDKDTLMAQTWAAIDDSSRKLRVGEWNELH